MTLIEITVVLCIITAASALAIPSIVGVMPRFQLNSQVSALHNDLQRIRLRSINLNEDLRVRFTLAAYPDADTYRAQYYDPDTGFWAWEEEIPLQEVTNEVDIVTMTTSSTGTKTVGAVNLYFYPDGTADASEIYVTNSKNIRKMVTVAKTTGIIKVSDGW
jgi:Tfp pilus assembly protein FimT